LTHPFKTTKNKRVRDQSERREFKRIRVLDEDRVALLDKLRNDLIESIERTVRIQQRFIKELRAEARYSDRVKHIIQAVEEVPFHSDLQRKIVDRTVTEIIDSKAKEEKRIREEKIAQKREESAKNCIGCLSIGFFD
jgi:hypothetical protein